VSTGVITDWCRACGTDAAGSGSCGNCGASAEPPVPGSARVGRVVSIKGKLGHRNGIVLDESGGTARVLVKGDEPVDMPAGDLDALGEVPVPGPGVYGAAGRLWKAQRAMASGELRAKWQPEVIDSAARTQAGMSPGARRAAALDAILLGKGDTVLELGLPAPEAAWYLARAGAVAGNAAVAIGWLEQLPAQGYALRVPLLLKLATGLLRDPALGARAASLVAPFIATSLDARALYGALAPLGAVDTREPLVPFAVAAEGHDGQLATWASSIARLEHAEQPYPDSVQTALALGAYLAGRGGTLDNIRVEILRILPIPLLDQLIDGGSLAPQLARDPAWPPAVGSYLRCRLTAGEATIPDLRTGGFTGELARRYFLAGDSAALAALPDGEAVLHYRALDAWRTGGGGSGEANGSLGRGLRPAARQLLDEVAAIRALVKAGDKGVLTEAVAADPTCWPLLLDTALNGSVSLPDDLAGRYPACAEWLDLCRVQRLVFDNHWAEVITTGSAIVSRTTQEVTSDEAQNMVAYAQLRQGKAVTALRTLDDALGGRYTTGLLVNASIVAATQGSQAALPYLQRITVTERDTDVRIGATLRAIDLWGEDAASPDYPPTLRDLVRAALSVPQPDDLHLRLLTLTCGVDTEWLALATTKVHVEGQDQQAALRFWRTCARASLPDTKETLTDVARLLGGLVKAPSPPDWVNVELRRMVKKLDELVHTDFGKAAHLKDPIEALLAAGVLDLADECVLSAQAGAHHSVLLQEGGGCITAADERRLLADAVSRYQRGKAELSEADRELVSAELVRCVTISARSVALVAIKEWDQATDLWNTMSNRERAAGDPYLYQAERRKLHSTLESWVARLRGYVTMFGALPETDGSREIKGMLTSMISDWSTELTRLRQFL
jgi:hypothetical protein